MKKIILAIALVITMGFGANAQSDSFFKSDNGNAGSGNRDDFGMALPGHGLNDDQQAPLGSGMLVLTALGAGYAIARRRK